MVDTYKLAIADVLKHPKLGLISFQPNLREPVSDTIRVRTPDRVVHYVSAAECDPPSETDISDYWKRFDENETEVNR